MALKSIDELLEAPNLFPRQENGRLIKASLNRRLLNGNFSELDADLNLPINWFKKVSDFFPEVLFSEYPEVKIASQPIFQGFWDELSDYFFDELSITNASMIAYGSGVLASHPYSPYIFNAFDPDQHFEIQNLQGDVTADILCRVRGETGFQILDVYFYPVAGGAEWRIYDYSGSTIGPLLGSVDIPDRKGRQVVILDSQEGSVFDSMKGAVGELSRTLEYLGVSVKNNARPHLIGSENLLDKNDGGDAVLNRKGSFLPVGEGDVLPKYLVYEGPVDLSKFTYEVNERNALAFAGLNSLLFNSDQRSGNLSGRAMRRLLLPFAVKLDFYSRINTKAIKSALLILNENLKNGGEPYSPIKKSDITVSWKYEKIFEDINAKPDADELENTEEND